MFLLVGHPYMLPGLAQSTLYLRTRGNLVQVWEKAEKHNLPKGHIYTKFKELFSLHDDPNFSGFMNRDQLASILYKEKPPYSDDKPRLSYANNVAERLLKRDEEKGPPTLNLLLNVWMDFLVYAANRCSRVSHADMLSNGGELTTILWLMTNYLHQEDYAVKREEASIMPEDHD
uniref:DUF4220 domain-containing protein n=1 Tax=Arundo donax TaxID=35708 RepID=A0A0A8Y3A6_ARUDO